MTNGHEEAKLQAIDILKRIDPKCSYGHDFFEALARIIVNVAVELVFLRWNTDNLTQEVLLRVRKKDETYPGHWHVPGSILRYGENIEDVFWRVLHGECDGVSLNRYQFVGFWNNLNEARGHALQLVYKCDVGYDNKEVVSGDCRWFSVESLPSPMVDHHLEKIIPMAVSHTV